MASAAYWPMSPLCVPGPFEKPATSQLVPRLEMPRSWFWRGPAAKLWRVTTEPAAESVSSSGAASSEMLAPAGFWV